MKRPHKQASKQKRGGTNARANKHAKTQIHNKNCNSPGLGPGRVRSLTGLFWYCSGIGIWLGEGLPSPLTPLPWASGSEKCLLDPSPKVAVSPFFAQLKPLKTQYVSHLWLPQGGGVIRQTLFFQSLGPKTHQNLPKTPQRPSKRRFKTPQDPQRHPKMAHDGPKMVLRTGKSG